MRSRAQILVLVTMVFIVGAWISTGERLPSLADSDAGTRLFPGLELKLNDITRIRIERGGSVYEVARKDTQWQLRDKGGYPVLFERVKPLLLGMSLLEKVERKTGKPGNYARLGVEEPAADTGNTRIELYARGDIPVASLIVGGIRSGLIAGGRDGIYARISGDPRSWLVAGNLDIPEKQVDWVDRQIIHIKPKAVKRVTIRQPDGSSLVMERSRQGAAAFTLVNLPEGAALKDGVEINLLARSLAGLNMEDVLVRSEAGLPENQAVTAIFDTWDGRRVTAYTVEQEQKLFAWFAVGASAAQNNDTGPGSRLDGWVYQIPRSRGDKLRTRLDDMTRAVPLP